MLLSVGQDAFRAVYLAGFREGVKRCGLLEFQEKDISKIFDKEFKKIKSEI
jgi:hypothetical protein